MGGLTHFVQQERDWAESQPAQAPPRCVTCEILYLQKSQLSQRSRATLRIVEKFAKLLKISS